MSGSGMAIAAALLLASTAAPEQAPPADLLEYLGSWEGADDEWLIFDERERPGPEKKRGEPEQHGDEATEEDHEN